MSSKDNLQKLLAQRVLARRRLLHFTQVTYPTYEAGWVHDDICRRLEKFSANIVAKKSPRLMLLLPPRSGKSELASIRFPAWHLGHNPTHEIINVGYNLELPMRFSRKVRELIRDPLYQAIFPDTRLDAESQSVEAWNTTQSGGFTAAGVGGGITGKGAHCVSSYSTVVARRGIIPAQDIRIGEEVLGYDHRAEENIWVRVAAVSVGRRHELRTVNGVDCTPDHRVWTTARGYVASCELTCRDCILEVRTLPADFLATQKGPLAHASALIRPNQAQAVLQPGVRARRDGARRQYNMRVRREESSPRQSLPVLLHLWASRLTGGSGVQAVWGALQATARRIRKRGETVRSWASVLLADLLHPVSAGDRFGGQVPHRRLFAVPRAHFQAAAPEVLRPPLLRSLPGGTDGGQRLQRVQGQLADTEGATGLRRWLLPFVPFRRGTGSAPHRPQCGEQCGHEPVDTLSPVPHVISSQMGVSARELSNCVSGHGGHPVIDLQTSSGNFYVGSPSGADGHILVHNCLIVDDPLKNADDADSVSMRDKLEEWYQSTAYTRLAPGGGVLLIECLTGGTLVLMADGTEKRLDRVQAGDGVATYENGRLTQSIASGWKRSGRDYILKITTKSGRIVRANGRHPFLATTPTGELKWIRAQGLNTACAIVAARGIGELGPQLPIAPIAEVTAISESDILELSPSHWPLQSTSDFMLDPVLSVEPDGEEDVYDLRVDRTTNFIANGLVVSNTFWNDDDLAGRLLTAMAADPSVDQFEVVRYAALSEKWEYRDETTGDILRFDEELTDPDPNLTFLRPKDFCLHEARYPTDALKRIRANLEPRIWSALYQQNPVPDEGMYFKKEFFRYQKTLPEVHGLRVYTAWDFAISEKQRNDWTVGATILQDAADTLYVLDIFRMKGDSFQIVEAILDVALRWSLPSVGYTLGVEDGQIWRAIEPLVKKRMNERRQFPPYEVLPPLTDKLSRARPLQGRMQQGRVVFPEEAEWLAQAQHELLRFPAGVHDDVVDALAWAVRLCIGKDPPRAAVPPSLPSWRDKLSIMGSGGGSHMAA